MMRIWKLSKLADQAESLGMSNRLIIHICEKCGFRTPISPNLNNCKKSPNWTDSLSLNITDGYCDKCNMEFWKKLIDQL